MKMRSSCRVPSDSCVPCLHFTQSVSFNSHYNLVREAFMSPCYRQK